MAIDRDDLIEGFYRRAPERVAEATDLWLSIEGGDQERLPELRRLLHTVKGEAQMLGIEESARILSASERLVDEVVRTGSAPGAVGDVVLGALEALGLLAESRSSSESFDLSDIFESLETALQMLDGADEGSLADADTGTDAGTGDAPSPAPASTVDTDDVESDTESDESRHRTSEQFDVDLDRIQPLFFELRRLHGEHSLLLPELAEIQRQVRALLVEMDPTVSGDVLRERLIKTLGYGAEVERRLTQIRESLSANEFSTTLTIDQLGSVIQRASLVSTDDLRGQVHRIARQTARALGKEIEVTVTGDALLDAAIERRLRPCLLHLVRNAVDHGIEDAGRREELGKSAKGHVTVSLAQSESSVRAVVEDDGGGIEFGSLRRKLAEEDPDAGDLSDAEVLEAIFHHGVTVRREADDISGRGVGLDVVARELAAVGGNVKVESTADLGTRFVLTFPATLQADVVVPMVLRGQQYAVAARSVVTVDRVTALQQTASGMHLRLAGRPDELAPAFSLSAMLHGEGAPAVGDPAVLLTHRTGLFALTLDGFHNPRPVTFTRTEELPFRSPLVRGIALLADGGTMQLLDVDALHTYAVRRTRAAGGVAAVRAREPHILVVEDAPVARELLTGVLRSFGLRVSEAGDGRAGLRAALEDRPDLVLTDLEMPFLGGLEMIARLREEPTLADLPVVVLTTRADPETQARAKALGVEAFMSKQRFEEDRLREILDSCLRRR